MPSSARQQQLLQRPIADVLAAQAAADVSASTAAVAEVLVLCTGSVVTHRLLLKLITAHQ